MFWLFCSMFPKSTHETFAQKLYQTFKNNKRFIKPKLSRTSFTISHYAGEVTIVLLLSIKVGPNSPLFMTIDCFFMFPRSLIWLICSLIRTKIMLWQNISLFWRNPHAPLWQVFFLHFLKNHRSPPNFRQLVPGLRYGLGCSSVVFVDYQGRVWESFEKQLCTSKVFWLKVFTPKVSLLNAQNPKLLSLSLKGLWESKAGFQKFSRTHPLSYQGADAYHSCVH